MKRLFPDKPLGKPVKAFDETFSAQTVIMGAFFGKQPPETESRHVVVSESLWAPLIRYAIAEGVNLETAVNQFIRDGLESA